MLADAKTASSEFLDNSSHQGLGDSDQVHFMQKLHNKARWSLGLFWIQVKRNWKTDIHLWAALVFFPVQEMRELAFWWCLFLGSGETSQSPSVSASQRNPTEKESFEKTWHQVPWMHLCVFLQDDAVFVDRAGYQWWRRASFLREDWVCPYCVSLQNSGCVLTAGLGQCGWGAEATGKTHRPIWPQVKSRPRVGTRKDITPLGPTQPWRGWDWRLVWRNMLMFYGGRWREPMILKKSRLMKFFSEFRGKCRQSLGVWGQSWGCTGGETEVGHEPRDEGAGRRPSSAAVCDSAHLLWPQIRH